MAVNPETAREGSPTGGEANAIPARLEKRLLSRTRFPFLCLLGFVATQGYLVPVVPLQPLNWAAWPSLPDLFGLAMVVSVFFKRIRSRPLPFDHFLLRMLMVMEGLFIVNFLFVTIPASITGNGIRFAAFTIFLLGKYILVYWAASQIPLDNYRIRLIFRAALVAFLWLTITTAAARFGILDLGTFTQLLPSEDKVGPRGANVAGKWNPANELDSTVGNNHGTTTVVLMVIGGLVVLTARKAYAVAVESLVFLSMGFTALVAGSRQGIIRVGVYALSYLLPYPRRIALMALLVGPVLALVLLQVGQIDLDQYETVQYSMERQMVLLTNPLTNEALSGRPMLWASVIDTLNESPIRWLIGYGMGNFMDYKNNAHNMILLLLQDGGLVFLIAVTAIWVAIFDRLWRMRKRAWPSVALFFGLLSSSMTSAIFYPNLATGWYLGLFFITLHIQAVMAAAPAGSAGKGGTRGTTR